MREEESTPEFWKRQAQHYEQLFREFKKADQDLSGSYIRIRKLVGTLDRYGGQDHLAATERAVKDIVEENRRLKQVLSESLPEATVELPEWINWGC